MSLSNIKYRIAGCAGVFGMALYSYLSQPQEDYAKASAGNIIIGIMAIGAFIVGATSGWQCGQEQNHQQMESENKAEEKSVSAIIPPAISRVPLAPLQSTRVTIWVDRAVRDMEQKI